MLNTPRAHACRSFGWSCLILADLGRSWHILSVFLPVDKRNVVCKHRSKKGVPNQQQIHQNDELIKWHQHRPTMGPIWPRGVARATNKSTQIWTNNKQTQTQSTNMTNNNCFFMCGDFLPPKSRRAQRLSVYWCFMNKVINTLYKTGHEETQKK